MKTSSSTLTLEQACRTKHERDTVIHSLCFNYFQHGSTVCYCPSIDIPIDLFWVKQTRINTIQTLWINMLTHTRPHTNMHTNTPTLTPCIDFHIKSISNTFSPQVGQKREQHNSVDTHRATTTTDPKHRKPTRKKNKTKKNTTTVYVQICVHSLHTITIQVQVSTDQYFWSSLW